MKFVFLLQFVFFSFGAFASPCSVSDFLMNVRNVEKDLKSRAVYFGQNRHEYLSEEEGLIEVSIAVLDMESYLHCLEINGVALEEIQNLDEAIDIQSRTALILDN